MKETAHLIVYYSYHHGNTKKVAEKIAAVLDGKVVSADRVSPERVTASSLVGFGSGIYFGKHHRILFELIDKLPCVDGIHAFMFATSGARKGSILSSNRPDFNLPLEHALKKKGFKVIGAFDCRGFDTVGPLKLVGGICKGRPNREDLEKAALFARDISRFS